MAAEAGPVRMLSPDAGRRRAWGTGAGLLATAGIVVGAMAIASHGGPPASSPQPVTTRVAVAAQASSPNPHASGAFTATPPSARTTVARTPVGWDLDGDGRPDAAATRFLGKRTAEVVVRLATGKALTSKAFPLYRQAGAGKLFAADINGDHQLELFVSDPGADGIGYRLFAFVHTRLVPVAPPHGTGLYIGGGMYYAATFGCSSGHLVLAQERPEVKSTTTLPADPRFRVTTTSYVLSGGTLRATGTTIADVADRAAAAAVLAVNGNGCGTRA